MSDLDPKVIRQARAKTAHSHKDSTGRKAWSESDADPVVGEPADDGSFAITFGPGLGGVSVRVHTDGGGLGYTLDHEGRPHSGFVPPKPAAGRRVSESEPERKVTEPKAEVPKAPAKPKRKRAPRKKKAPTSDK